MFVCFGLIRGFSVRTFMEMFVFFSLCFFLVLLVRYQVGGLNGEGRACAPTIDKPSF